MLSESLDENSNAHNQIPMENEIHAFYKNEIVTVTHYLGNNTVRANNQILHIDQLKFINPNTDPFTSVFFDPQGRLHYAE